MAAALLHCCVLPLSLALLLITIGCVSGEGNEVNNERQSELRTDKTGRELNQAADSSPVQYALGENHAMGGRELALFPEVGPITTGWSERLLGSLYSILHFWNFPLDIIRSPSQEQDEATGHGASTPEDHNILFVLGDSPFDAGNNLYLNESNYPVASYPYGYTYFSNATGRVCDGRILPDFIAEYANLPLIPPSLQPGGDFYYGANFASSGAAVLDSDGSSGLHVLNLKGQVIQFKELVAKWNETLGADTTRQVLAKAVYLFSFGGNDYHNYYEKFYDEDSSPTPLEQEQFVKYIVGNTTDALIEMYELGARKIAFQNVGPMGCLPECKTQFPKFNGSCIPDLLSMPTLSNKELNKTLTDLAERLEGFKFSIFDYFIALMDRIENPSEYGFVYGSTECYSDGNLCEYPSAYVFFDEGHTTQCANEQLAKLFWEGDLSVTSPYNMKQLFEESKG
ncbi:GDSL lipase-like [Punica granatum]|uniref:GDSL lipase-like n=1 Tax=Punica granatum TaxID=22663 RepID=A0A6P8DG82_PUNGR|nr:GDSL lipase-like [Punica granatum]